MKNLMERRPARTIALAAAVATVSVLTLGGMAVPATATPNKGSERIYTPAEADALWSQVQEYINENPLDLAGIEQLTMDLYDAKPMAVSVNDIEGTMTGAEAQQVLDARTSAWEREAQNGTVGTMSVPVDAFSVSFAFISRPIIGAGNPKAAYGTWDFRDNYVNGSDPDDMAAIRLNIELDHCARITSTYGQSYYWNGTVASGNGYLHDAGVGTEAPIYGFNDATSGFQLNVDHGYVMTDLEQGCGPNRIQGMFTYEHNQDGGTVAGVSASWGGFSVSYSGAPSRLQKSSGIAVLN